MKKSEVKRYGIKIIYLLLTLLFLCVIGFNVFTFLKRINAHSDTVSDIQEINDTILKSEESEKIKDDDKNKEFSPPNTDYWNYIKVPITDFNLKDFKKLNNDTVGFLSIYGTQINYPVVKTNDNSFYLNHSFKKGENGAGWVFMDYRNDPENLNKNTILYAHSNLDKTMFGSLSSILNPEWFKNEDNGILSFANSTGITHWKIFSVYTIPAESKYIQTAFSNDEEYRIWAKEMAERSRYNLGYRFSENEKIITLSTCYDNIRNLRLVVHAKYLGTYKWFSYIFYVVVIY